LLAGELCVLNAATNCDIRLTESLCFFESCAASLEIGIGLAKIRVALQSLFDPDVQAAIFI
jgi:hypothetical protein